MTTRQNLRPLASKRVDAAALRVESAAERLWMDGVWTLEQLGSYLESFQAEIDAQPDDDLCRMIVVNDRLDRISPLAAEAFEYTRRTVRHG